MAAPKGHPDYTNGSGGRPPKYSLEEIEEFADEFLKWLKNPKNIWYKDFCLDRDINPDFMSKWCEVSEKFRGVYEIANHRQESRLINGGLTTGFNSSVVKMVLCNKHGYKDKTESKVVHTGVVPEWIAQEDGKSKDLVRDKSSL
jgi:hypothetical protein